MREPKPNISVVYKITSSNNTKIKLEVFKNTLVDDIINERKTKPLLPKMAEILEIGVGNIFEKKYKKKYGI